MTGPSNALDHSHAPRGPGKVRVLVVGDSIALGASEVRVRDVVGYVSPTFLDRLREQLSGEAEFVVDAEPHRTTIGTAEKIESLLTSHRPDVAMFVVGGSDADVNWRRFIMTDGKAARSNVALPIYLANLRKILAACAAGGVRPVLTDVPNHDLALRGPFLSELAGRDVTALIATGGGQEASDRGLVEYRRELIALAEETGTALARYGEALSKQPRGTVHCPDGVHPNAEGHRLIAAALLPVLERVLQRQRTEAA